MMRRLILILLVAALAASFSASVMALTRVPSNEREGSTDYDDLAPGLR